MMNVGQIPFDTNKRKANLHINLKGVFTSETAKMLSIVMEKSYQGKGNIFVHTKEVTVAEPDSKYIFYTLLRDTSLPK